MNKQQAFDKWTKLNNIHWTPDLIQDIDSRWHDTVISLHKQIIGRKQSDFNKAYNTLVDKGFKAELEEAIKPFQAEVNTRYQDQKAQKEALETEIKSFARGYIPKKSKGMNCLRLSQAYSYSTQPSHNKYAREALAEDIRLLEILGFETEVKAVNGHNSGGMYSSYYEDYELWGNLSVFDFEMLKLSGEFISVLNWAVLCWRKGTNPKVYFQFLSNDDYEKSQVLAYQCNYEITKDNMKLELSWDEINQLKRA
jgi:hypothetical protein